MRQVKIMHDSTPYGIQEKVNKWAKGNEVHLVHVDIKHVKANDFMANVLYEEDSLDDSAEVIVKSLDIIADRLIEINASIKE